MIEMRLRIWTPSSGTSARPATRAVPDLGAMSVPSVRTVGVFAGASRSQEAEHFAIADQFTISFDAVFTAEGIRIVASPPQAPRANAICERIIGTLRREVFDRLLIVNQHHLRRVLTGYLLHYNTARPHRFLSQLTPAQADSQPPEPIDLADHRIRQKQVLGGLTCEYYIAALPPRVATEKRRSPPESYSEPHRVRVTTSIGVDRSKATTPPPAGMLRCQDALHALLWPGGGYDSLPVHVFLHGVSRRAGGLAPASLRGQFSLPFPSDLTCPVMAADFRSSASLGPFLPFLPLSSCLEDL